MEKREILFRGKRKDNGEWVKGDTYLHDPDLETVCIGGYDYYTNEDGLQREEYCCEVDPTTVCQYTGLTDKNGRKIFEGDILYGKRYHDFGQGGEYLPDKCVVRWNEKRAAFEPVYWWEGYNHDLKDYEVIGNIFDNPELIGGAEKWKH